MKKFIICLFFLQINHVCALEINTSVNVISGINLEKLSDVNLGHLVINNISASDYVLLDPISKELTVSNKQTMHLINSYNVGEISLLAPAGSNIEITTQDFIELSNNSNSIFFTPILSSSEFVFNSSEKQTLSIGGKLTSLHNAEGTYSGELTLTFSY